MSKRNIEFDLDFEQKDILPKFAIKQFDNALISISTFLRGEPLNPAGNTCKLYVSTGNDVFLQESNIRTLENLVEIDLDKNVISLDGKAFGELELKDGNGTFTSATFIFNIDNKVGEGSTLPNGVEGFIAKHERLIREFKEEINPKIDTINNSISDINIKDSEQDSKLDAVESKNTEQDVRLKDVEYKNKVQDVKLQGLFNENSDGRLTIEGEGNNLKLEGSKEGLVEVDKVVGNTMVNIVRSYDSKNFALTNAKQLNDNYFKLQYGANVNATNVKVKFGTHIYKANTTYTLFVDIKENTCGKKLGLSAINSPLMPINSPNRDFENLIGISSSLITTKSDITNDSSGEYVLDLYFGIWEDGGDLSNHITFRYWLLEGDYTNKPIPNTYFEGMQSSFEECKVTQEMVDEGLEDAENLGKYKYEVEVRGKNLFNNNLINSNASYEVVNDRRVYPVKVKANTNYILTGKQLTDTNIAPSCFLWLSSTKDLQANSFLRLYPSNNVVDSKLVTSNNEGYLYIIITGYNSIINNIIPLIQNTIQIEEGTESTPCEPYYCKTKKVYLNSPLYKNDELIIEDGELKHYHKMIERVFKGNDNEPWIEYTCAKDTEVNTKGFTISYNDILPSNYTGIIWTHLCDNLKSVSQGELWNTDSECISITTPHIRFRISRNKASNLNELKQHLKSNPYTVVYELAEPWKETIDTNGFLMEIPNSATISIKSVVPVQSVKATYTANIPSVYGLQETNNNQDNLIDISLCATDEMYMMIEPILEAMPQTININKRMVSKMVDMYVAMVIRGLKTIEEVPVRYRKEVQDILNKLEK